MLSNLKSKLKNNAVAIIATDTLYGIVGSAHSPAVVARIYDIKGRAEHKPFIILIPDIQSLDQFGVVLSDHEKEKLSHWWPGAVTVILPLSIEAQEKLVYLHRGSNELAFRLPAKISLQNLLQETGPLVAPSANPQGQEPAHIIDEAKAYFGDAVDWYEDEGRVEGLASTIVRLHEGTVTVLRQGSVVV